MPQKCTAYRSGCYRAPPTPAKYVASPLQVPVTGRAWLGDGVFAGAPELQAEGGQAGVGQALRPAWPVSVEGHRSRHREQPVKTDPGRRACGDEARAAWCRCEPGRVPGGQQPAGARRGRGGIPTRCPQRKQSCGPLDPDVSSPDSQSARCCGLERPIRGRLQRRPWETRAPW